MCFMLLSIFVIHVSSLLFDLYPIFLVNFIYIIRFFIFMMIYENMYINSHAISESNVVNNPQITTQTLTD